MWLHTVMAWRRVDGLRTLELGTPGRMRQELTALVLAGRKNATAGLYEHDYVAEGEALETVGEHLVVIGDGGDPVGTVEVTRVEQLPFDRVSDEFARAEGEGFADHEDWARAHRRFWEETTGHRIDADTPVVCLGFRLLPTNG
jgi:uncharacterized protein YhfF